MLNDPAFLAHLRAGNQVFTPTAQDVTNLVAFLQTIDDETPIFPIPVGQTICPSNVTF